MPKGIASASRSSHSTNSSTSKTGGSVGGSSSSMLRRSPSSNRHSSTFGARPAVASSSKLSTFGAGHRENSGNASVASTVKSSGSAPSAASIYGSNKVQVHSFRAKASDSSSPRSRSRSRSRSMSKDAADDTVAPKQPGGTPRGYASSSSVGSASAPGGSTASASASATKSVGLYRHPNSAQRRLAAEKRKRGQAADDGSLVSRTSSAKRKCLKLAGSFALNVRPRTKNDPLSQFADPESEEGSTLTLQKSAKTQPYPSSDEDGEMTVTEPAKPQINVEVMTTVAEIPLPKEPPPRKIDKKSLKEPPKEVPTKGPAVASKKKKPMTPPSQMKLEDLKEKLAQAKKKKLEVLLRQKELQKKRELEQKEKAPAHEEMEVPDAKPQTLQTIAPLQPPVSTPDATEEEYSDMHPITALLYPDIIIADISMTGPDAMVRFPHRDFDLDLGRSALSLPKGFELPSPPVYDDFEESVVETPDAPEDTTAVDALAARKTQLQEKMDSLRQKLERKQKLKQQQEQQLQQLQANDNGTTKKQEQGETTALPKKRPPALSKDELQKRRAQAQMIKDVSYLKHFVSKQQHLLAQVSEQASEHSRAREESDATLARTRDELLEATALVDDLDSRHAAVTQLMSNQALRILHLRERLHQQEVGGVAE